MNRSDPNSPTFGLPPCLHVPIAAAEVADIETFVGAVEVARKDSQGRVAALRVKPYRHGKPAAGTARLWREPQADEHAERLFPEFQLWVHVDYTRYRDAWHKLGMPPLAVGQVLDHVQNRKALRLRWCSHPWLRLCPVSRATNSNSGHATGAEGMERAHLARVRSEPQTSAELKALVLSYRIIYADPQDLTKMLDIPPGTFVLEGVRDTQRLFDPV